MVLVDGIGTRNRINEPACGVQSPMLASAIFCPCRIGLIDRVLTSVPVFEDEFKRRVSFERQSRRVTEIPRMHIQTDVGDDAHPSRQNMRSFDPADIIPAVFALLLICVLLIAFVF